MSVSIDRLTALDRVMLGASRIWPQDIGALAILDGTTLLDSTAHLRMEQHCRAIEARLHLVPRFRQIIHVPRWGLGGPLWVDDQSFDIDQHLREFPVPPPGGDAELLDVVEHLRRQPLDMSRPPWDIAFLTGLPDQRVGMFVRIHHTIADGMAAMITVASFLDATPDKPVGSAPAWNPAPLPSPRELLADNVARHLRSLARAASALTHPRITLSHVRDTWPAFRELVTEEPATSTSLDRMVGPNRDLALIRSNLDNVKAVGHAFDATVNDVLLAATAGGVRALLRGRGEPVDDTTVRIYVPVSLRRGLTGPQQGNLIAQMAIPLRLGESDPARRLQEIVSETTRRKAKTRTPLGVLMNGRIVRRLMLKAVMRQRVNLTSASIPGPPMPLYLAGARILEVFPVLPLIANEPLGIGALSYAGGLNIGIAADRDAFPDLDVFAAGVRDELGALESLTGSSTNALVARTTSTNRKEQP
jgi:diacylglycerol O-acyltransferase / wax synthase